MNELAIGEFLAFTIGMLVLFTGVKITRRLCWLREFNIPEAVTEGLLDGSITVSWRY